VEISKFHNSKNNYLSLIPPHRYNNFRYKFGITHKIRNGILTRSMVGKSILKDIEGGVFHSFVSDQSLPPHIVYYNSYYATYRQVCVECVIPKGSYYTSNNREYISNQLRITKIYLDNIPSFLYSEFIDVIKDYVVIN
jgi:hypothetical protein